MKILIASTNIFGNKMALRYFKSSYRGIKISPVFAGRFGWYWEKALKEIGHDVIPFISMNYNISQNNNLCFKVRRRLMRYLNEYYLLRTNEKLLAIVLKTKPDLLFIDANNRIFPETLNKIKKKTDTKIITWLLDDPIENKKWDNDVKSFPIYDYIFTFDSYYVEKIKELGGRFVEYLPCACDSDIHRTYQLSNNELQKYKSNITFLGTLTPKRISLLNDLSDKVKLSINIWTWNNNLLKNHPKLYKSYRGMAWGEETGKIYSASEIVINFHHEQSIYGTNMRTFEAAGCGSFQLVEEVKEISKLFKIGDEIVTFKNLEDLSNKINYYLEHKDEKIQIAKNAQKRVHNHHTYLHRMKEILSVIK